MSKHSLPCHLLVLPFLACPIPLEFHPQRLRIPRLRLASFLRAIAATQSPSPCLRGFGALASGIWSLKWEGSVLTRRPGRVGDVTPFERLKSRVSKLLRLPSPHLSRHQRANVPFSLSPGFYTVGEPDSSLAGCSVTHAHIASIPDSAQGRHGCCELRTDSLLPGEGYELRPERRWLYSKPAPMSAPHRWVPHLGPPPQT